MMTEEERAGFERFLSKKHQDAKRLELIEFVNKWRGRNKKNITRKRALGTIFKELDARTYRQRIAALRKLRESCSLYSYRIEVKRKRVPRHGQLNDMLAGLQEHSSKLADLLSSDHFFFVHKLAIFKFVHELAIFKSPLFKTRRGLFQFVKRLRAIEYATMARVAVPKARPKDHMLPLARECVVAMCNDLYAEATGKPIGAGRKSYGKPSGPFIRLVHAALIYVGDSAIDEHRGHDAVLTAIKRYQERRNVMRLVKDHQRKGMV
jgi:hypothetical protein